GVGLTVRSCFGGTTAWKRCYGRSVAAVTKVLPRGYGPSLPYFYRAEGSISRRQSRIAAGSELGSRRCYRFSRGGSFASLRRSMTIPGQLLADAQMLQRHIDSRATLVQAGDQSKVGVGGAGVDRHRL